LRLFQEVAVSGREGLDEGVRKMILRHFDEVAIERREEIPVLGLVGFRLAAPGRPLRALFELAGRRND